MSASASSKKSSKNLLSQPGDAPEPSVAMKVNSRSNKSAGAGPQPMALMSEFDFAGEIGENMKNYRDLVISVKDISEALELFATYAFVGFQGKEFKEKLFAFLASQPADYTEIENDGTWDSQNLLGTAGAIKFVISCLICVCTAGTKIKAWDKRSPEAQAMFKEMAARGVALNPKVGSQGANVITLQRMAAVCAREMSLLMGTGRARLVGDAPHKYFPKALLHPNVYSLIPKAVSKSSRIHILLYRWRINFSTIVMAGPGQVNIPSEADIRGSVDKFNRIISDSDLYNESERSKILVEVLFTEYNKIPDGGKFWFAVLADYMPFWTVAANKGKPVAGPSSAAARKDKSSSYIPFDLTGNKKEAEWIESLWAVAEPVEDSEVFAQVDELSEE